MVVGASREYHPHAACLMFQACRNGNEVAANLAAVVEYGMKAQRAGVDLDQAMHDITTVLHSSREGTSENGKS